AQFLEARYHREQHPNVVARSRPEDRPQLNLEESRHLERDADRTPPQKWIFFARNPQVGRILVGADIQRAYRDWPPPHRLEHLRVQLVLLVIVGKVFIGQKRKLRAQQADSLRAVAQRQMDVGNQRDVRQQHHLVAVARGRRLIILGQQLFLERLVAPGEVG